MAEALGGREINLNTRDADERRILNVVEEMADMMSSSRSFQMNVDVMNTAKSMMQRILTLGQQ